MIVQCRNCQMRYELDEQVVGSKGCHVRCTSCGHIWHQLPLPQSNAIVAKPPLLNESIPPSASTRGKRSWMVKIMWILSYAGLFTAGAYSPVVMKPWIQSWKELIWPVAGLSNRVEIESFQWRLADDQLCHAQGKIYNRSEHPVYDPEVIVEYTMLDEKTLTKTTYKKRHVCYSVRLLPQQSCEFQITVAAGRCVDLCVSLAPQK